MKWMLNAISKNIYLLVSLLTIVMVLGGASPVFAGRWSQGNTWEISKPFPGTSARPSMSFGIGRDRAASGMSAEIKSREIRHTAPRRSLRKLEPVGMPTSSMSHLWVSPLPGSGHNYLQQYSAR